MALPGRSRALAWLVAAAAIGLACIQFVRPELTNPPVTAELQAPPTVKAILRASCYNCHSNETRLSWFDWPVPAYWIVARDVREGRKRLNFSKMGALSTDQQKAVLFEAVSQIELGAMPLPAYQRVHPGSAITAERLAILKEYLDSATPAQTASAAEIATANTEYDNWIQSPSGTRKIDLAPNGIAFLPEYKNWKAISSTDRSDNHTMRIILGNDVAIKAIAENHISPWPDGTAFAKVAWRQQLDDKGVVRTGAFYQVEFMIRDSERYAGTLGWGWARWRGVDLRPYGRDANFTAECVGCHRPLRGTDYVFTEPIRGQQ